MACRLPLALRNLKLDFEPLDFTNADSASPHTIEKTRSFVERVEGLAFTYLYRRPLLIQTASLKGPFDGAWADSNPWVSRPNAVSTALQVDDAPTIKPDTPKRNGISKTRNASGTTICGNALQTNHTIKEAEIVRPVKRRRKDRDCIDGNQESIRDNVRDHRNESNGHLSAEDRNEGSRNIHGDPGGPQNQQTPRRLILVHNNGPIDGAAGNGPQNLLTPSDSEHASPCYVDSETDHLQTNLASLELFARDNARDRVDRSTQSKIKSRKEAAKKKPEESRKLLSQPLPEKPPSIPHGSEPCVPSTLPTMDSIKTNEQRHKQTMNKIFPRPIEELERAVGEWAFELGPSPRCNKEASLATTPSAILLDTQCREPYAATTESALGRPTIHKQHLNKPGRKRRFMTFDTPPVPAPGMPHNLIIESKVGLVAGEKISDTGKLREQASRSLIELPLATSCAGINEIARHDDRFAVLDGYTNTIMSPAEAVRAKRLARKSGASLSSTASPAANFGAQATKDASPYVSTQVEWEQAYQAFQEGLSSPVKQADREQGPTSAEPLDITPFSRFKSPEPRTPPPVDEIQVDDEVQVMNTQELFDAVPVFSMGSARRASFAPPERNGEVVAQSFGFEGAADMIAASESIPPASRPRSSHVDPRSIMKKAPSHGGAMEFVGSSGMNMDLWLDEAESFLAPFDIEAEMNKAGQGTPILSQ